MRWSMLVLTTSLLAAACSGDDGGGGPPTGGTGGGGGSGAGPANDSGLPDADAPEPGTCRPLCCADSDCGGGTCTPLDATAGTLGTCTGGTGGGTTDAGGALPASCWTATTPECNPLTNEKCGAGGACDVGSLGDPETKPVVSCYYDDNIQGPDEDCDNAGGPYCVAGYHCVPK